MQTVYYASSCSDGYVSTYFYNTEGKRNFHYELDEEGFGATDSEGKFTCEGFSDFTEMRDILESSICSNKDVARAKKLASKTLGENDMYLFNIRLKELLEECSCLN